MGVAVAVLAAVLLAVAFVAHRGAPAADAGLRPSGLPPDVPTSVANEMALSSLPGSRAPGFTLVDQAGRTRSLQGFRGRVVVLGFMDPHCTDVCPIVSQELVDAYRDLGTTARHVVFLGVNVNEYFAGVPSVAGFSRAHRLDSIPSWHFLTGPASELRPVWHHYGVTVEAPNPQADIVHTSILYFIGPDGRERYVAAPQVDHHHNGDAFLPGTTLRTWGQGIALVSKSLLT